jgi:hypothetical protein
MLSLAMAKDCAGLGQERCVRMSNGGPSARSEVADGGGGPAVGGPITQFSHVSELRGASQCGSFHIKSLVRPGNWEMSIYECPIV